MRKNILLVVFSILLFSCGENNPLQQEEPDAVSEIISELNFATGTSNQTISFTTNKKWEASLSSPQGDVSWCTISPTSGNAGSVNITVSTTENTGYDDRSVTLTIKTGNTVKNINITQKQKNAIIISKDKFEISDEGGTFEVEANTNVELEVSIPSDVTWIKEQTTGTKALTNKKIIFNVGANETYDERKAKISIKDKNSSLKQEITVIQKQKNAILLTKDSYEISDVGGNLEIQTQTNVELEVIIPSEISWLKVGQSGTRALTDKIIYLNVSPNDTYDERKAKISLKDKNSSLMQEITIIQRQNDAIILKKDSYEVSDVGGQIVVEIKSNVKFNVEMPNLEWVTIVSSTIGSDNFIYNFNIKENNSYDIRKCSITFKQLDGSISDTLFINQLGKEGLGDGGSFNSFIISNSGLHRFSIGNYVGTRAFLLWNENGEKDIIDVELKDGYIYFNKPFFKKGNAVISLENNGKIVWSWHIWSTDEPSTILVNGQNWMDRNMGATSTIPNDPGVYGLSYNPGNPFPFPGARYTDYTIASTPSVPSGWYVAPGFGFYTSSKMPTPDDPMQLCTNRDSYGNSVYFRLRYNQLPSGYQLPSSNTFQQILGYEPQIKNNGVYVTSNLYIPCIYGGKISADYGQYLCNGIYNTTAVDTWTIVFYQGVSKRSYVQGAALTPIRCYR